MVADVADACHSDCAAESVWMQSDSLATNFHSRHSICLLLYSWKMKGCPKMLRGTRVLVIQHGYELLAKGERIK
jgi:hypothetical protein